MTSRRSAPTGIPCAGSGVIGLVMAAGSSTRMGGRNKLFERAGDTPLIEIAVRSALASRVDEVLVVTGADRERVERSLAELPVRAVWNPRHAGGLSTSLKAGVSALPEGARGVVVCLGDMPRVTSAHIDRLIEVFHFDTDSSIFVPTWKGQRGNPVLWSVDLVPEIATLSGDVGVRTLIARHPTRVREVAVDAPGILTDVDTLQALESLASPDGGPS